MRFLRFPICAFFGHEAVGLSTWLYTHDATECWCGRQRRAGVWWAKFWRKG